jgi:carboxypeptidase family protein
MLRRVRAVLLIVAAGCGAAQHPHAATVGTIAGLARDRTSGDPVALARITLRADGQLAAGRTLTSRQDGTFAIANLAPGRYSISAEFAGQPVTIDHVDVHAGDTTVVDVTFTLGTREAIHLDFGDPKDGEIARYHSAQLDHVGRIEGVVVDAGTRTALAGTAVTASGGGGTLEAITNDQGRYRFDGVRPGAYTVSAYYSIGGRGQIEIRRSDIAVDSGDDVIVPLWVETNAP